MAPGAGRAPIVVLAALREELAPLRAAGARPGVRFELSGVGPRRADAAVRARCAGARLILSTGCCGGLVTGAEPGLLVIPERVLGWEGASGRATEAPPPDDALVALARQLAERQGLHCTTRPLATVRRALHTPEQKRACHQACGAVAVDMETAAVAAAAAALRIPYLSLRYVLDTARETLPDLRLTDEEGRLQPGNLVRAAARPRELLGMAALLLRMRSHCGGLARLVAALLGEVI